MTLDEAKEYLADEIQPDGSLYDLGWYLYFVVGDERATLDGAFSADDLEAIAAYMRAHPKDSPNG